MPVWMLGVRIHNPHGPESDHYKLEHDVIDNVFDNDTVDTVAARHVHEPGRFNRIYTQEEVDLELAKLKKIIAALEDKLDKIHAIELTQQKAAEHRSSGFL